MMCEEFVHRRHAGACDASKELYLPSFPSAIVPLQLQTMDEDLPPNVYVCYPPRRIGIVVFFKCDSIIKAADRGNDGTAEVSTGLARSGVRGNLHCSSQKHDGKADLLAGAHVKSHYCFDRKDQEVQVDQHADDSDCGRESRKGRVML